MKLEFPYFDVMAILIPGFMASVSFFLLCDEIPGDKVTYMQNLSLGGVIFIFVISYIMGEILQAISKFCIEVPIFKIICGGMPLEWMDLHDERCLGFNLRYRTFPRSVIKRFNADCKKIAHNKIYKRSDFIRVILMRVKTKEEYARDLAKTRAESKMFRSFSLIPIINMILILVSRNKIIIEHSNTMLWMLFIFFIIAIYRYCKFSIKFARKTLNYFYFDLKIKKNQLKSTAKKTAISGDIISGAYNADNDATAFAAIAGIIAAEEIEEDEEEEDKKHIKLVDSQSSKHQPIENTEPDLEESGDKDN